MEEGRSVLESVHRILVESNQFKAVAEAAQKECDRLRHEAEQLRVEFSRLTAETERVQQERAETAQWLTTMLNEAASRFRIEPPPA
jgi:glutathionylspermidine synthase